jgi:hypothetical protein
VSAAGVRGFFAKLASRDGKLFFDGRETLKDFVQLERHVADGCGTQIFCLGPEINGSLPFDKGSRGF